jgi:hypothetical protein
MSILAFIPAAILGAVFCTVVCVCLWVEHAERRRARLTPKRRRVFRPVIIQGGKAQNRAASNPPDADGVSPKARRPNRL